MKVTIAGNTKDIAEGTTLAQLVIDEFVENHDLANVVVKENDNIEFLYFMGGGSF